MGFSTVEVLQNKLCKLEKKKKHAETEVRGASCNILK